LPPGLPPPHRLYDHIKQTTVAFNPKPSSTSYCRTSLCRYCKLSGVLHNNNNNNNSKNNSYNNRIVIETSETIWANEILQYEWIVTRKGVRSWANLIVHIERLNAQHTYAYKQAHLYGTGAHIADVHPLILDTTCGDGGWINQHAKCADYVPVAVTGSRYRKIIVHSTCKMGRGFEAYLISNKWIF
jgi:hypothetical protein